ncbi:hypothetical protein CTAYLR_008866 [Chrysophaeum taylorii]|uniref:Transcription elongation factor n=1 Tax=Chrysophaeum taylorii TaxID=2483200 RepID=A0AAD7XHY8_9STRA|nr:hypothetical protein CTAYLR_008866 [Chrysophaeum taylorii]
MVEVKALVAELSKCGDDNSERVVDIIKALDEAGVTVSMLHELRIGTVVAKYRKNENAEVAEAAKALVKKWREMAAAAGVKSEKKKDDAPTKEEEEVAGFSNLDVSDFRSNLRQRLLDVLKGSAAAASARCYSVAEAVEAAVCDLFPQLDSDTQRKRDYAAKVRQLIFNLKKNDDLRERLLAGGVAPDRLASMSADELAPSHIREQRAQARNFHHDARSLDWSKKNRDTINKQIGVDDSKGMFQCKACGSKRVSNYEKQTRSADEPMTQFFECVDCGKRWRT